MGLFRYRYHNKKQLKSSIPMEICYPNRSVLEEKDEKHDFSFAGMEVILRETRDYDYKTKENGEMDQGYHPNLPCKITHEVDSPVWGAKSLSRKRSSKPRKLRLLAKANLWKAKNIRNRHANERKTFFSSISNDGNHSSVYASEESSYKAGEKSMTNDWIELGYDHLSDLILNLESAVMVGAKESLRALKMLLYLTDRKSQESSNKVDDGKNNGIDNHSKGLHKTRIEMVRAENGKLVPVLLRFLNRCMVHSKEHNLTLHLLIKLSVPYANKKKIAIDYRGAEILAKFLCEEPSCHLVALVLVNLTYDALPVEEKSIAIEMTQIKATSTKNIGARKNGNLVENANDVNVKCFHNDTGSSCSDASLAGTGDGSMLRRQLLASNRDIALVESLAFALRVASLTHDEYESRRVTIEGCNYSEEYLSPATRLSILMAKDQQLRESSKFLRRRVSDVHNGIAHMSPTEILEQLRLDEMEWKQRKALCENHVSCNSSAESGDRPDIQQLLPPYNIGESSHIYPQTARWCLAALRNLTKPSNRNATAAHILIKSGMYSHIVQYITTAIDPCNESVSPSFSITESHTTLSANSPKTRVLYYQIDDNFLSASYGGILLKEGRNDVRGGQHEPTSHKANAIESSSPEQCCNGTYLWESNSYPDAALSIVFNLAASSKAREYMNDPLTVRVLSMIAEYPSFYAFVNKYRIEDQMTIRRQEIIHFQSLKARMALSYLVGSQGHFGQAKLRSSASTIQANRCNSPLILSRSNIRLLMELLANTFNQRGKDGSSCGIGYLKGTFSPNSVIFSLRCLLTHTTNQERIAYLVGPNLNALLFKALAQFSLEPTASLLDSESAGHAVFISYLLSNFGMQELPFLPELYGPDNSDKGIAAKILVSYLGLSECLPAGKHAARQLLLRIPYLNFGRNRNNVLKTTLKNAIPPGDLKMNYILIAKINRIQITEWKEGVRPDPFIFHRPVLRYPKPCNWDRATMKTQRKIDWNNSSITSTFSSAIIAVQQLSFGSMNLRRQFSIEPIDEIAIANSIVQSACNKGESDCCNFIWAWRDVKMYNEESKDNGSFGDMSRTGASPFARQLHSGIGSVGKHVRMTLPLRQNKCFVPRRVSKCSTRLNGSIGSFSSDDERSFFHLCCDMVSEI